MKQLIFFFLCLFFAGPFFAQQDTIYWYSKSDRTDDLDIAKFYQLRPFPKKDSLYEVKNYFLSGKLHMLAYWSNPEEESFQGKAIWYYEDGQKLIEANYIQNKLEGKFILYHQDGTIKAEGLFKNDRGYDGVCAYVYYLPEIRYLGLYENGKRMGHLIYYADSKQIAKRYTKSNEETICYDKQGNEIARSSSLGGYENKKGRVVIFDEEDDNSQVKRIEQIFTYLNGKKEGEAIFYHKEKIIAKGIYKDDEPWEGDFAESYRIETFRQGKLFKKTKFYGDGEPYEKINAYEHFSENGKLEGERVHYTFQGKELARGIYKDDKPWNGTFNDVNRYTSEYIYTFENGVKVGPYLRYTYESYDYKEELIEWGEIKNGEKEGMIKFRNPFDNSTYQCQYIEGKPFAGTAYDCYNYILINYSKGEKISEQYLDDKTGKPYLFYTFGNGEKVTRIYKTIDKEYKLNYKDGDPYNGCFYDRFDETKGIYREDVLVEEFIATHIDYVEYKNGKKTGPFKQYENYFSISGTFKDNLYDGLITFYRLSNLDSLQCIYKEGIPMDGSVWDGENLTEYKNGRKHGLEILEISFGYERPDTFLKYNKIHKTYQDGILDGPVIYYDKYTNPPTKVGEGIYKDGAPYDGIFSEKLSEKVYHKGKISSHIERFKNSLLQATYKNGEIQSETVFLDHGPIKKVAGVYKNNKPHNGSFLKKHDSFLTIEQYKNGIQSDYQYYLAEKSYCGIYFKNKSGIDSLLLKNGQPYEGKQVEVIFSDSTYITQGAYFETSDGVESLVGKEPTYYYSEHKKSLLYRHTYKNGVRIASTIHDEDPFNSGGDPNYIIQYTANGYEAKAVHPGFYDRTGDFKVTFTDQNQTSGIATFSKDSISLGHLKFEKGKVVEMDIAYTYEVATTWHLNKNGTIFCHRTLDNIHSDFYPDFSFPENPSCQVFINILEVDYPNGIYHFTFSDEKEPFTSAIYRKDRFYEGYLVYRLQEEELYEYRKYKNGKVIEEDEVTKEELLKITSASVIKE